MYKYLLYIQNSDFVVDKLSQPNMATSSGLYGKMFSHTTLREKLFSTILFSYYIIYITFLIDFGLNDEQ